MNDPLKIKGYRNLSVEEIGLINSIKVHGEALGKQVEALRSGEYAEVDLRWVSIGETHLQQGLMALIRAVAKPKGF